MKLTELLTSNSYQVIHDIDNCIVSGISYNSKTVEEGHLFVCMQGVTSDGHQYAKEAVQRGAVAIVAQHFVEDVQVPQIIVENPRVALGKISSLFYGEPSKKLRIIGVTGTNGKTTVTHLLKSLFEHCGYKVGLIGTNNNLIGEKTFESKHTTPESLELNALFSQMVEEKCDIVVMEVSSHSLALDRVSFIDFEIGIFTNLTQDHLDFHKTMDQYLEAKTKLFQMCKIGIINADDPYAKKLIEKATCSVITYGIKETSTLTAFDIVTDNSSVAFMCKTPDEEVKINIGIPGIFSVYNALCAVGTCYALKIPFAFLKMALKNTKGVKGRCEVVPTDTDFTVIIDYAHTPDGLSNIISTLNSFKKARVITVFGCGGDRDKTKRPMMGKIAAQLSDFSVVTSDNPRSEEPEAIIRDVLEGVKPVTDKYEVIANRKEAIKYALKIAQKDDIVLLAGKGHETYQILKDRTIDFDEREIIKEILG